jgi:ribosomal protein S18 acetylase RimI-like enzyme
MRPAQEFGDSREICPTSLFRSQPIMTTTPAIEVRPARPRELDRVRELLIEAIDYSVYYSEAFKAYERKRFDAGYLRALTAADPWYVAVLDHGTHVAGVVVMVPEFGTLWSPWIYMSPKFQKRAMGIHLVRTMIRHWENGRFHKLACYVRPENETAMLMLEHFGFTKAALLKRHMFGEDYWLLERPLNKVTSEYDTGVRVSRLHLLKLKLADAVGW